MASIDTSAVRAAFPALREDQIYLDNAGGSQVLGTVIDSYVSYPYQPDRADKYQHQGLLVNE